MSSKEPNFKIQASDLENILALRLILGELYLNKNSEKALIKYEDHLDKMPSEQRDKICPFLRTKGAVRTWLLLQIAVLFRMDRNKNKNVVKPEEIIEAAKEIGICTSFLLGERLKQ